MLGQGYVCRSCQQRGPTIHLGSVRDWSRLFLNVGHVNKEGLLYIWDQYVIGLDSPGFIDDYLPAVSAVLLMLLSDRLKGADTVRPTDLFIHSFKPFL